MHTADIQECKVDTETSSSICCVAVFSPTLMTMEGARCPGTGDQMVATPGMTNDTCAIPRTSACFQCFGCQGFVTGFALPMLVGGSQFCADLLTSQMVCLDAC